MSRSDLKQFCTMGMAPYHLPSNLEKIYLLQLFLLMSLTSAQATTLIGPLSTIFTPPVTCNSITAFIDIRTSSNNVVTTEIALYAGANVFVPNNNCYPPGYNVTFGPSQYYSPGICPSGWYMLAIAITSTEADFRPKSTAVPIETIGFCCPVGYTNWFYGCASTLTSSTIAAAYWNGTNKTGSLLLTSETIAVGPNTVTAPQIEVRWQAGDIIGTQTSSVSQRSQTSSGIQPNSTSPIHPSTLSHGLSGGAKIGIGLGIPSAFLLLTGFLALVYVRKFSQSRQERVSGEPISEPHVISETEISGAEKQELDGTPIHLVSGFGQDLTSRPQSQEVAPGQEAISQHARQPVRWPDVQTGSDESSIPSPLIKPV